MTDATDKVACGDDLERMLRFLLRGDPRDEGLDSVDETADRLSGAGLETRGQGFEARRETRRRTATMQDSRHRSTLSVVIARGSFARSLFPDFIEYPAYHQRTEDKQWIPQPRRRLWRTRSHKPATSRAQVARHFMKRSDPVSYVPSSAGGAP
jgi:hypothetical protein